MPLLGTSFIILAILPWVLVSQSSPERAQKIYQQAQHECGSEVWFVIEDLGVMLSHQTAPFPSSYKNVIDQDVLGYECTEQKALRSMWIANKLSAPMFVLVLFSPVLGFIGAIILVLWFIRLAIKKRAITT